MNNQDLIDAGYKRYGPSPNQEFETDLFEKCIRDDKGKKYYIHIYRYDFGADSRGDHIILYEAKVQLNTKNEIGINVTFINGWELKEMEQHCEDLWNSGLYDYYEEYSNGLVN